MWIFLIILFIIGFVIVWPVLQIALKIHRQYRQFNNMMNGAAQNQRRRNGKRDSAPPHPPVKKKKIDSSVGEYVEFEELSVEAEQYRTADSTTVKFKVEQQITDVEFEELP